MCVLCSLEKALLGSLDAKRAAIWARGFKLSYPRDVAPRCTNILRNIGMYANVVVCTIAMIGVHTGGTHCNSASWGTTYSDAMVKKIDMVYR